MSAIDGQTPQSEDDPAREPLGADAVVASQEVRRRHVLYVPGYDPRDPGLYRRLAAFELRRFARLWGARVDVDRAHVADEAVPSVRWSARVAAGAARVEVVYETLRWDDIVAKDFARPLPMKILRGLVALGDTLVSGTLYRVARAAPWCAIAWCYPVLLYFASLAFGATIGATIWLAAAHAGLGALGAIFGAAVAVGFSLAVMYEIRRSGDYSIHLMDDGCSQRSYLRRHDPELERRIDAFAARIRAVKADDSLQEILIVGHSSGSFIAIDALARAYEADPQLGAGRPQIALLTVGAIELLVALHPRAGWFRERLKAIAAEPTIFWAEVVAPWDVLNFPNRDPVTELRLDLPADRPNPTFRRAYLTKMLKQEAIDKLTRERNVFRAHFQFIMANEVKGPFDYFSLVCGPWRVRTQFRRTRKGAYMSPFLGAPSYPPAKEG